MWGASHHRDRTSVSRTWRTLRRVAVTGTVLSLGVWTLQAHGVLPSDTDDHDRTDRASGDEAALSSPDDGGDDEDGGGEAASDPVDGERDEGPTSGWPAAATTGADEQVPLAEWTGPCQLSTPGQVVENVTFRCAVEITAPGVVVRNAVVEAPGDAGITVAAAAAAGGPALIEDVTVRSTTACRPTGLAVGPAGYHARRVEVQGFGQAFLFAGDATVVEDSYMKMCSPGELRYEDAAVTGVGAGDASEARPNRFVHNTVDQRCAGWAFAGEDPVAHAGSGDPADQACDLAPAVFWIDAGDGLELIDNLLRGGAYTIDVGAGSGHTVTGNVVERGAHAYEPVFACTGMAEWSHNRLADVDASGAVHDATPLDCPDLVDTDTETTEPAR